MQTGTQKGMIQKNTRVGIFGQAERRTCKRTDRHTGGSGIPAGNQARPGGDPKFCFRRDEGV